MSYWWVFTARCTLVQSAVLRSAIACRPSVCPSVTLVDQDHTGWKSWKLIARTLSLTPSLFVAQKPSTYSQGTWGNCRENTGGVGKSGVLEHKSGNISETRTDIEEKLLWRAYRNSPTLFPTVQWPTPYGCRGSVMVPFPKIGGSQPHPKLQLLLYLERVKLCIR